MFESWSAYESLAREYHRDMLERSAMARLAASVRRPSGTLPWLRGRLRAWLGRQLLALGTRLQDGTGTPADGPLEKAR